MTLSGKGTIEELAGRLTALGEQHAGVHWATIGWILPLLHDPDGHEVRFYTQEHHTALAPGEITTVHDPRESAERRERKIRPPSVEPLGRAGRD